MQHISLNIWETEIAHKTK